MSIDSFGGVFCLHLHGLSPTFILSLHLHQRLLSDLFPTNLPTKALYVFLFPPIHSKCCTNFILHLITRNIFKIYEFF